jgi:CubicO group peptidase (beta-lactamase class C family)
MASDQMNADVATGGFVADGFAEVVAEFQHNFSARGEFGASFAVVQDGELVVDLWGGIADRAAGRPWCADTMQLIFSGTKGLVAICLLMLIERGQLELDAPVGHYWPEFAAGGKADVTVRHVVTHTARLPGFTRPRSISDLLDGRRMAALLAAQPQIDDARASRMYHPLTYGWLCGEIVRRVDGRSVGRFFADEVARPLELELFIGLPAEFEARVSRLELADTWGMATGTVFDPAVSARDELTAMVWANPPIWTSAAFPWNSRPFHEAEVPAVNGIGTARAIASLYGNLDRLLSPATLVLGSAVLEQRHDPVLDEEQCFGVGFELQTTNKPFGPPTDAFGHTGAGGSVHGRWPAQRIGFSYAMNLMRDDQLTGDARPRALLDALYRSCTKFSQNKT